MAVSVVGLPSPIHAAGMYGASNVLGQPDYNTLAVGSGQNGFKNPSAVAIDSIHHRTFVADYNNSRVLVFDSTNVSNGMNASNVLGQPDFATLTPTTTQSGMRIPNDVDYDPVHNRLFVSDSGNKRVLVYDVSSIANGMNASNVIGQPDFTTATATPNQGGFASGSGPCGISYDSVHDRLFATDFSASRLLVFDTSTITNGMNASNVIGQANFTTFTAAVTQSGLNNNVQDVQYVPQGNLLFIADDKNSRVMVYDASNITNGMNASYVLGQTSYTTATLATTQSGMKHPSGMGYDQLHNRLYVSDRTSNRITTYDLANLATGMNASRVYGAPDYTTDAACALSDSSFCVPQRIAFETSSNSMYVPENYYNRVTIFRFAALNDSVPGARVGGTYSAGMGSGTQGATTYAVTSGTLPPGITLDTTTGELSGMATKTGSYTFTISLSDDNGNAGINTDTKNYTLNVAAGSTLAGLPNAGGAGLSTAAIYPLLLLFTMIGAWAAFQLYQRKQV